jgi:hypothetical protein
VVRKYCRSGKFSGISSNKKENLSHALGFLKPICELGEYPDIGTNLTRSSK